MEPERSNERSFFYTRVFANIGLMEIVLKSLQDTQKIAKKIAKDLVKNSGSVLALYGNLGSGKTTFTQFLAKALGVKEKILSPTFVIMKTYKRDTNTRIHANDTNRIRNLVHIDTYRLNSAKDLTSLGLKDLLKDKENILVIEWPEKVEKLCLKYC